MNRTGVLVAGLVVAVLAGVLAFRWLYGDEAVKTVEAKAGVSVPELTSLNRADDLGADTVRAYLAAVLRCDTGAALPKDLSLRLTITEDWVVDRRCAKECRFGEQSR